MNELLYSPKIKPEHLARKAIVYLRQSSEKQVRQNTESQRLQYDMADRIRGLGWQEVEIINSDLGISAAIGSICREGFERVLSSVALGEVGSLSVAKPHDYPGRTKIGAGLWRSVRSSELLLETSNRSTI